MSKGQWCEKHWNIIRDDDTINGIFASMRLMQILVEDDEFYKLTEGKVENFNTAMAELSPICCHIGDDKLTLIIEESRKVH